jgi:hypothetical protein
VVDGALAVVANLVGGKDVDAVVVGAGAEGDVPAFAALGGAEAGRGVGAEDKLGAFEDEGLGDFGKVLLKAELKADGDIGEDEDGQVVTGGVFAAFALAEVGFLIYMEGTARMPQAVGEVFDAPLAPGEAGGENDAGRRGQGGHAGEGGMAGFEGDGFAAVGAVAGEAEFGEKQQVEFFGGGPPGPGGGGSQIVFESVHFGGAGDGAHPENGGHGCPSLSVFTNEYGRGGRNCQMGRRRRGNFLNGYFLLTGRPRAGIFYINIESRRWGLRR